jgi:aspartate/methionine/tyrosine aminotransferase|tara:strand:+ start:168 stop:392 length:225 start_codon:yes stop_codon:yes gene_type:complete
MTKEENNGWDSKINIFKTILIILFMSILINGISKGYNNSFGSKIGYTIGGLSALIYTIIIVREMYLEKKNSKSN